ncbi:hypothetical protein ERO13_D05G299000v2 [Gossypium hirsutum]|uniref:Uncharacterized protein n=1 Tax=Gossypium tomentosum TaxID=34277 RepID=A0A5D2L359_GOSTO|nr:hypothetical protein ERO13_D05G299000v2 [Gossypium hirsutum]TYH73506.1 hypothetical protein ES332_D05G333900v1 [Gossypium tomentosum]
MKPNQMRESVTNSGDFHHKEMSDSPQTSPSRNNAYPPSGKPVGGSHAGAGEDSPQSANTRHASPPSVMVLAENDKPDKQNSHDNSHLEHHQSVPSVVVPSSTSEFHQKDQSSIQDPPKDSSSTLSYPSERSVEGHLMDHAKNPKLTSSDPRPVDNHGGNHLSEKNHNETEPKAAYEKRTFHRRQDPPLPETGLPKPPGYPPPGRPTSPSKLEPQPNKGKTWLEKICCCCCWCCSI